MKFLMTLREILEDLDKISDEFVIYASKNDEWNLDSPAALVLLDDAAEVDLHLADLTYFLEIEIAKEVLEVWKEWRDGREPTESERVEAVLYYANNDAYLE